MQCVKLSCNVRSFTELGVCISVLAGESPQASVDDVD